MSKKKHWGTHLPQKLQSTLKKNLLINLISDWRVFRKVKVSRKIKQKQFYPSIIIEFFVYNGNNSEIVINVLSRREFLQQSITPYISQIVWKPFSTVNDFDQLQGNAFNHIEGHEYLTRKELMYIQLSSYCKLKNIDSKQFIPETFLINVNSDLIKGYKKVIAALENSQKYWLFKPPDLNRGCGIKIIKDLEGLKQCLKEYQIQKTGKKIGTQKSLKMNENIFKRKDEQDQFANNENKTNLGYVVVQEYISKPLLINNRKFDIRMWMLIDQNRYYYQFKEGYIRLSGIEFQLDDQTMNNLYIHLTNNAIQKNHNSYGCIERGNQMNFAQFEEYLNSLNADGHSILNSIIKKTKEIMQLSVRSVRNKMNVFNKQWQFELMGFDFMIDQNYQVWLIEINTNPCLELSSPILQQLIPRMLIDDLFRITIDDIFNQDNSKNQSIYRVDNYKNEENLFQFLGTV